LDHASGAATHVARPGDGKEALLVTNLAGAVAGGTTLGMRAGFCARAFARVAGLETRNAQLRSHAFGGLFECDLEVVTKGRATLRGRASRATARAAKHVAKSKQVAEDVFDTAKTGRAPVSGAGATRNARVSKPVVTPALFGVG